MQLSALRSIVATAVVTLFIVGSANASTIVSWGLSEALEGTAAWNGCKNSNGCNGAATSFPAGMDYVGISGGYYTSFAWDSTGTIHGWGEDEYDHLTDIPGGAGFSRVMTGRYHSIAIASDGTLESWGRNNSGTVSSTPGGVYTDIGAGKDWSVALKANGEIDAWGKSKSGNTSEPGGSNFVNVAAGRYHGLALTTNGSITQWGRTSEGQTDNKPTGNDFTDIDAGRDHSVALHSDGSITTWGSDTFDLVTDSPTGNDFVSIESGYYHASAVKDDGTIVTWGRDVDQNGNTTNQTTDSPPTDESGYSVVSNGYYHGIALYDEPDDPIGTLTMMGNETFDDGGLLNVRIDDATGTAGVSGGWDLLHIDGTLTVTAGSSNRYTIDVDSLLEGTNTAGDASNFATSNLSERYSWTIVTTTGGINGFSADSFQIDYSGITNELDEYAIFELKQDGFNLVLTYVPEPGTGMLVLGGLLALSLHRKP